MSDISIFSRSEEAVRGQHNLQPPTDITMPDSLFVCAHISEAYGKLPARQIQLVLISNSDITGASALVHLLGAFILK